MSSKAKICFLGAFVTFAAALAIQFMTGMWLNINTILLALAATLFTLAVVFDWKLYLEFLTMRTTKHGMNMGAMIFMVLTLTVCLNYLANKHNKTFDFTQEKLNSLSDQSTKLIDGLKGDIFIKIFYKGPSAQEQRQGAKQALTIYEDHGKVKVQFINAYVDQALAMEYLKDLPDREQGALFMFVDYNGRKVRVEEPFDESNITSAMIKSSREGEAKIYFVRGHGERDVAAEDDSGIKDFARALGESSFKVESLSLLEKPEVPADATIVAIIGPAMNYLDQELEALRKYAQSGGRLFISLDPGQRHNLANLTKSLGVQFSNNYVLTKQPLPGAGPATVIGPTFDPDSDITKSFPLGRSFALFPLASEVKAAEDRPADIEVQDLVKSDASTFTVSELKSRLEVPPETKPVTVAVTARGGVKTVEGEGKKSTGFQAVIFGDSDFLTNRALLAGINRDLALNAVAFLANQKDLISIKPKLPKGSMITLTMASRWGVILGGLSLPLVLMVVAAVVWFRRRGA